MCTGGGGRFAWSATVQIVLQGCSFLWVWHAYQQQRGLVWGGKHTLAAATAACALA
jgi:hypothetical protein